jgi:hypothetical protein
VVQNGTPVVICLPLGSARRRWRARGLVPNRRLSRMNQTSPTESEPLLAADRATVTDRWERPAAAPAGVALGTSPMGARLVALARMAAAVHAAQVVAGSTGGGR